MIRAVRVINVEVRIEERAESWTFVMNFTKS